MVTPVVSASCEQALMKPNFHSLEDTEGNVRSGGISIWCLCTRCYTHSVSLRASRTTLSLLSSALLDPGIKRYRLQLVCRLYLITKPDRLLTSCKQTFIHYRHISELYIWYSITHSTCSKSRMSSYTASSIKIKDDLLRI